VIQVGVKYTQTKTMMVSCVKKQLKG